MSSSFPTARGAAAAEAAERDDDGSEPGILVAVGDVAAGEVIFDALSPLHSRVVLVASATLALRELDWMRPALLVVDDELPLVRGLDLAGRVRGERPDVEVILLTDDAGVIDLVDRLHVERIRVLQKPIDLERLRQAAGVGLRALASRRTSSAYADLLTELEDQKARFERRIEKLERQSSERPPAPSSAPPAASRSPAASVPSAAASAADGDLNELPADLHVLVVDDDPLVRRAIARTFRRQHVTLAENGVAATRALERSRPDVIVSDLKMPEMDGLALAEEVKRRWPELADRIVFVSGTGSQIERAHVEAPSQQVLRKPIQGRQLESRIAEVLEKALLARKR